MTSSISKNNYPTIDRLSDIQLYKTKSDGFCLAADDVHYSEHFTKHQLKEFGAELIKIADDDSVELGLADWIVEETDLDKTKQSKQKGNQKT